MERFSFVEKSYQNVGRRQKGGVGVVLTFSGEGGVYFEWRSSNRRVDFKIWQNAQKSNNAMKNNTIMYIVGLTVDLDN